jgi:hypothetical protein
MMQTEQIVELLVAERDRLSRAIEALQGSVKRRGRPPRTAAAHAPAPAAAPAAAKPAKRRKRAPMSAAARKEQSERMKAFWAARRKQKSK